MSPSGIRWAASLPVSISSRTPHTIERQHCRSGVSVAGNLYCVCDALTPGPGCQSILEWLRGGLKPGHELFGHGLGDEASDNVTNNNSPHSSIRLLQRCHLPHSKCCENLLRNAGLGERLSSFVEHVAILIVVQERTQMFCPHCRRDQMLLHDVPSANNEEIRLCPTEMVWLELTSQFPEESDRVAREGVYPHPSVRSGCPRCREQPETLPVHGGQLLCPFNPLLDSVHPGATPSRPNACCTLRRFPALSQEMNPLSVRKFLKTIKKLVLGHFATASRTE